MSCSTPLAKGAKWKFDEQYVVDPTGVNPADVDVLAGISTALGVWNTAAEVAIFETLDPLGSVDGIDTVSPDNKNEMLFGGIAEPGVIAVTITWGIFSGLPRNRELVEWDMQFNNVDFDWSDDVTQGTMDFLNIAAHEAGHAAGMGHPDNSCTEETMYFQADFEETKKRDLGSGDIAGIVDLYN